MNIDLKDTLDSIRVRMSYYDNKSWLSVKYGGTKYYFIHNKSYL